MEQIFVLVIVFLFGVLTCALEWRLDKEKERRCRESLKRTKKIEQEYRNYLMDKYGSN